MSTPDPEYRTKLLQGFKDIFDRQRGKVAAGPPARLKDITRDELVQAMNLSHQDIGLAEGLGFENEIDALVAIICVNKLQCLQLQKYIGSGFVSMTEQ